MRRNWTLGLGLAGLAVVAVLGWAWRDAGIEPVRPLTAPAVVPGAPR